MATTINKRQQARHERALQDLISGTPGNNKCADCSTSNPGWASWNLGIFLCMRCASLHRKLGTHISKVKSLSMDTWTAEQVDSMKSTGNVASNKIYNPRNVRPTIPLDPDEVDMSMEKHIREKYQRRTLSDMASMARTNTGSTATTASTEDRPPPPPPKPSARFGSDLRSSPAYPSPHSSGRSSPAATAGRDPSALEHKSLPPLPRGGANVQIPSNVPAASSMQNQVPTYIQHAQAQYMPQQPTSQQAFQDQNIAQPQSSYSDSNPFYRQTAYPQQQQQPHRQPLLQATFQSMHLQQAALTPNATGGWQQQVAANNPFLRSYTPPVSPAPPSQMYNQSAAQTFFADQSNNEWSGQSGTNPFMPSARSQTMPISMMHNGPQQNGLSQTAAMSDQSHLPLMSPSTNPFYTQSQVSSPAPMQYQDQQYFPTLQQQQQQPSWPEVTTHTDVYNGAAPDVSAYGAQPQGHAQAQQMYSNPAQHNKSSILALYGRPELAPPRPAVAETTVQGGAEEAPIPILNRRSVTMPVNASARTPGSKNPFATATHSEQPEIHNSTVQNGEFRSPSPDAFRSLSSIFK